MAKNRFHFLPGGRLTRWNKRRGGWEQGRSACFSQTRAEPRWHGRQWLMDDEEARPAELSTEQDEVFDNLNNLEKLRQR